MLRLPSKLLLFILLCSTCVAGDELRIHGTDQAMWIAVVSDSPKGEKGPKTRVRVRTFGGEQTWRELSPISGRVVSLASRGQTLAVLLDTGDWLLTYPGGDSIGPSLPSRQKIQYLTSEKETIYAVASKGDARASTTTSTAPATTGPVITTWPSTQGSSDPSQLELYRLDKSKWEYVGDLPSDLPQTDMRLRVAIVQGKPTLAIAGKGGVIRVVQWDGTSKWNELGLISPKVEPSYFELLNIESQPAIWLADATGAGQLSFWKGSEFAAPVELPLKKALDAKSVRDAIYAKGNIREVVLLDQKLLEQCFRADGKPSSDLTELSTPRQPGAPMSSFPQILLMIGLAALILASMRKSELEEPVGLKDGSVRLAPLGTRVLAGLIDLTPFFAAGVYLQFTVSEGVSTASEVTLPMILAGVLYFVHTTLLEVLTTRTIGKFICGLKVISVDGGRPTVTALLLRNLLRAVDLFPAFPLSIMIAFTPMRQRVGDVTARTLVITTREPAKDVEPTDAED